jgi:hypothetical protein
MPFKTIVLSEKVYWIAAKGSYKLSFMKRLKLKKLKPEEASRVYRAGGVHLVPAALDPSAGSG